MDTTVSPASVEQWGQLYPLLRRAGIGADEVQLLINDVARRNLVAQVWLNGRLPEVELPDEFNKGAMERFIKHVFKQQLLRLKSEAARPDYELADASGRHPLELATTEIMKDLFEGLSPLHVEVAILRGGFIDGYERKPAEVAEQLGITEKRVNIIRAEVRRHVEAVQRSRYPFVQYYRAPRVAANMSIYELGLTSRTEHSLLSEGIRWVGEITEMSPDELRDIRNFGESALRDVEARLEQFGLSLRLS